MTIEHTNRIIQHYNEFLHTPELFGFNAINPNGMNRNFNYIQHTIERTLAAGSKVKYFMLSSKTEDGKMTVDNLNEISADITHFCNQTGTEPDKFSLFLDENGLQAELLAERALLPEEVTELVEWLAANQEQISQRVAEDYEQQQLFIQLQAQRGGRMNRPRAQNQMHWYQPQIYVGNEIPMPAPAQEIQV
jgi:hypothetical protein